MTPSQTVAITGATSGLGRLAAITLSRQGFRLALIARSPQKAADTRQAIRDESPNTEVDIFLADLDCIDDVRHVGAEINNRYGQLDVLINNAGLHGFTPRTTPDGYPEMVAVNYLAPFVLTETLLPALQAAPAARIVNVASEASRNHGTLALPDDLVDTTPFTARESSARYGKTKLMNIMFTMELARRLADTNITANCLDPGFNVTGLGRELRFARPLERILTALRIGDPNRGADLIVALATQPEFATDTGQYVTARGHQRITPVSPGNDPHTQLALWELTADLLATKHEM